MVETKMKYCRVWGCERPAETEAQPVAQTANGKDGLVLPKGLVETFVAEAIDDILANDAPLRSKLDPSFAKEALTAPVPEAAARNGSAFRPSKKLKRTAIAASKRPDADVAPKDVQNANTDLKWVFVALFAMAVLMILLGASVHSRMAAMESWLHGRLTAGPP